MPQIRDSAVIDPRARLGPKVRIGPFCLVGGDVVLGEGCVLHSHVVIDGRTEIGARSEIFPFASLGHRPQDLKYSGEPSRLVIGEDTVIREHVTMNPGTTGGGMVTRTGRKCLFMVGAHVAHDCQIGDRVIMANNATLAGHVSIGDDAIIGGLSAVHQFVRIGRHAMVGGMSGVEHDVIPFGLVMGDRARLAGLNLVGLKRRGFSRDEIHALDAVYKVVFAERATLAERLEEARSVAGDFAPAQDLLQFLAEESARGLCKPTRRNGG